MHVFEELPGVVFDHPEDVKQSLVSFSVDIQGLGAEFGQCAADEMGEGEAQCDLAIVFGRCGFDDLQLPGAEPGFDFFISFRTDALRAEDDFVALKI